MSESIEERVREALDARASALDGATLSRLRQAREAALRQPGSSRWLPDLSGNGLRWAGAAAGVLLLVVALSVWRQAGVPPQGVMDDLEVLASSEDLDLYRDLDFYLWLEQQEGALKETEGRT